MKNIYIAGSSDNIKNEKNNYLISSSNVDNEVTEFINDGDIDISTTYTITDVVNWKSNNGPSVLYYKDGDTSVYKYHNIIKTKINKTTGVQSIIDNLNRKITLDEYNSMIPINSKLTPSTLNTNNHFININENISVNRNTYGSQLVKNILNTHRSLVLKVPDKKLFQIRNGVISNLLKKPPINKLDTDSRSVSIPKTSTDIFLRIEYSTNLRYENGVFKSIPGNKVLSPMLKYYDNMVWNGFIFTSYEIDNNTKGINVGRVNDKYTSENLNLNIDNTNIQYVIKEVIVI